MKISKNTICLWYEAEAEAAARFYAETFPESSVSAIRHAPSDLPSGKAGDEATRAFEAMMTMKKINVAAIEAARRG